MQSINNLNEKEFVNIFKDVFEKTQWIAEKAYTERPFIDFSDLIFKMINIFENTTKENQLKIIKRSIISTFPQFF